MTRKKTTVNKKDIVLPFVIFLAIFAIGCKFMLADYYVHGGLAKTINALCLPSSPLSPRTLNLTASESYVRKYTYISAIDTHNPGPCHLITFFQLLLDAPPLATTSTPTILPREFLTYALGTGLPCVLVLWIEAYRYRGKQHWLLRFPTFWLLIGQILTVGMMFPLFWSLVVISRRGAARGDRGVPISKIIGPGEAQALAFGLVLGAILPSAAMVLLDDHYTTWVWQTFPIYVSILRALYSGYIAPTLPRTGVEKEVASRAHEEQSRRIIRRVYIGTFLLSASMHIRKAWPFLLKNDFRVLAELFIPTVAAPGGAHPSVQAVGFLKWDYALGYSTFLLGLLWSARSKKQVAAMLLWYVVAVPIIGMGGTAMVILCWRDGI